MLPFVSKKTARNAIHEACLKESKFYESKIKQFIKKLNTVTIQELYPSLLSGEFEFIYQIIKDELDSREEFARKVQDSLTAIKAWDKK